MQSHGIDSGVIAHYQISNSSVSCSIMLTTVLYFNLHCVSVYK